MKRLALPVLLAVIAVLVTGRVVSHDLMYRVDYVDLYLSSDRPGQVEVFYQHPPGHRGYSKQRRRLASFAAGSNRGVRVPMNQLRASRLRFRLIGTDGSATIHSLFVRRWYAGDIMVRGADLAAYLEPVRGDTRIERDRWGARLISGRGVLDVQTADRLDKRYGIVTFLLPLLMGALVFELARRFNARAIPSLAPLYRRGGGNDDHIAELDGLRGLAAISVVADHTWGLFSGSGLAGVWIFFALSGYLLAIPFVRRPGRIIDSNYVRRYLMRRVARIVPMYYVLIFMLYVVTAHVDTAVAHFLFLRGDGHLWTIPQEMVFYLCLPVVVAVMGLLLRYRFPAAMIVLVLATGCLLRYEEFIPFNLAGLPSSHTLFVGWFLAGMLVSYLLNHDAARETMKRVGDRFGGALGWLALALAICLFVAGSTTIAAMMSGEYVRSPAVAYRGLFGVCAAALVFAAVIARHSVFGAVLRFAPLRSFGIIGYSAYLLHPLLISVIRRFGSFYAGVEPRGFVLFAFTLALTWLAATVTYNLVEHPFLVRSRGPTLNPAAPR